MFACLWEKRFFFRKLHSVAFTYRSPFWKSTTECGMKAPCLAQAQAPFPVQSRCWRCILPLFWARWLWHRDFWRGISVIGWIYWLDYSPFVSPEPVQCVHCMGLALHWIALHRTMIHHHPDTSCADGLISYFRRLQFEAGREALQRSVRDVQKISSRVQTCPQESNLFQDRYWHLSEDMLDRREPGHLLPGCPVGHGPPRLEFDYVDPSIVVKPGAAPDTDPMQVQ